MNSERDLDTLRSEALGHVRDDPEVRDALEKVAEEGYGSSGDAAARVILDLADGSTPDPDDVDTLLWTDGRESQ